MVVISDCSQFGPGQPAITYGLRGLAYFELRLTGPKQDLHSGTFGGAVSNPAIALAKMMAALIDEQGRIQVPGFYDDVLPLTDRERKQFASLPFDEARIQKANRRRGRGRRRRLHDARTPLGPADVRHQRPHQRLSRRRGENRSARARPARNSASAWCRIRIRRKSPKSLEKKLRELCPPGIKMELIEFGGAPGVVVPLESPYVAAAAKAIEHGFGNAPVFIREGGSIPIVTDFPQATRRRYAAAWAGARTTTTRTAPTKNSAWPISTAASKPARVLWEELAASIRNKSHARRRDAERLDSNSLRLCAFASAQIRY